MRASSITSTTWPHGRELGGSDRVRPLPSATNFIYCLGRWTLTTAFHLETGSDRLGKLLPSVRWPSVDGHRLLGNGTHARFGSPRNRLGILLNARRPMATLGSTRLTPTRARTESCRRLPKTHTGERSSIPLCLRRLSPRRCEGERSPSKRSRGRVILWQVRA